MAFDPCPWDAVQSFNDPGLYYVRENGKLRSPPGYKQGNNESEFHISPRLSSFTTSLALDGVEIMNPKPLFQIMTEFVAVHLDILDSLVGFPDIVGKKIFVSACSFNEFGRLCDSEKSLNRLRLFCDAYPMHMLTSISLKDNAIFLEKYPQHLLCFTHLIEMDLSNCWMDDNNIILPHIGNHMLRLKKLILSNNELTDVALQRLTASIRVLNKGSLLIELLDLSGNTGITEHSLRYICALKKLKALDLTGCSISDTQATEILGRQLDLSLVPVTTSATVDESAAIFSTAVVASGWASPVIEQWLSAFKDKPVSPAAKNVQRFYKHVKRKSSKHDQASKSCSQLRFVHSENLHFKIGNEAGVNDLPLLKRKTFNIKPESEKKSVLLLRNGKRKRIRCKRPEWSDESSNKIKKCDLNDEDSLIKVYASNQLSVQRRNLLQALDEVIN